jgi:HSP20 family molecular chaperone IbpA
MFEPRLHFTAYKQPWLYVLDMDGFRPGEIKLKVDGNIVHVHARHEDVDGEDIDIIERKRVVKIPEGVDVQKMSCFIDRRGKMVFKAPFLCVKTKSKKENSSVEQEGDEMQAESKVVENVQSETNDEINSCDVNSDLMNHFEQADKETIIDSLEKEAIPSNQGNSEDDSQQSKVEGDLFSTTDVTKLEHDTVNEDTSRCDSPVQLEKERDISADSLQDKEEPSIGTMDVVEKDGQKYLSVKLDIGSFLVDSIRVRCEDKVLSVDAKRELDEAGKTELQEFHRQYQLPENACDEQAKAFVSDNGYFAINIPIRDENTVEKSL